MPFLHKHLVHFFYLVVITSLVYSPFLLSASLIALAVLCFFEFRIAGKSTRFWWNSRFFAQLAQYPKYSNFWIPSIIFFIVFLSVWQTEDYGYWWERVRIKIPFLALGMLFVVLPKITIREFHAILYFLIGMMVVTSIGIGINYTINFDQIIEGMKQGHPIPTPRNHIRFSLMLALSIVAGIYLLLGKVQLRYSWERRAVLISTIFLFLFMHFLSVRSGLFSLYAALGVITLQQVVKSKKWWLLLVVAGGIFLLPIVAYYTIPSFQTKINYMRWDIGQFREGKGGNYADSGRLSSLVVGWEILKEHPFLGVGAGNLRQEVETKYEELFPDFEPPHMPHNQYLFVAAGNGFLGLAFFLFAFFYPIFYRRNYRISILMGFFAIIASAFLIEHTIENSMGVGFVCFFLFWLMNALNRPETDSA